MVGERRHQLSKFPAIFSFGFQRRQCLSGSRNVTRRRKSGLRRHHWQRHELRQRLAAPQRMAKPGAFTTAPQLYPTQCATSADFCTTGFGDLGRNIYRGPFQQNWDFSLIKHFKLAERQDLRFAADFFNLWNHPNFGTPLITDYEQYLAWSSGPKTSPDPFGEIVSTTGTPRLIQFSLRWQF